MVNISGSSITITRGDTLDALLEISQLDGSAYRPKTGDVIITTGTIPTVRQA